MISFYILLFLLCCWGLGRRKPPASGLDRDTTLAIKGIFIFWVFIRHVSGYLVKSGYTFSRVGDSLFQLIGSCSGQLIVVMFLFYSGYGVMEQIKSKGNDYVRLIPRKRVLQTLLNFDVAVLIYIALDILLGLNISCRKSFFALIAWDSVGNSNWYIFVILLCYLAVYACFRAKRFFDGLDAEIVFVALFFVSFALSMVKPHWWYNTMLAFPAGMLWSKLRKQIDSILQIRYYCALITCMLVFCVLYILPWEFHGLRNNLLGISFATVVVIISCRVKVGNPALVWLGTNLFPLYIYQRVPMIVFADLCGDNMVRIFPVLYVVSCLCLTVLSAWLYRFVRISL